MTTHKILPLTSGSLYPFPLSLLSSSSHQHHHHSHNIDTPILEHVEYPALKTLLRKIRFSQTSWFLYAYTVSVNYANPPAKTCLHCWHPGADGCQTVTGNHMFRTRRDIEDATPNGILEQCLKHEWRQKIGQLRSNLPSKALHESKHHSCQSEVDQCRFSSCWPRHIKTTQIPSKYHSVTCQQIGKNCISTHATP